MFRKLVIEDAVVKTKEDCCLFIINVFTLLQKWFCDVITWQYLQNYPTGMNGALADVMVKKIVYSIFHCFHCYLMSCNHPVKENCED